MIIIKVNNMFPLAWPPVLVSTRFVSTKFLNH